MTTLFVLIEKIGSTTQQQVIFPKDRDVITFGRNRLCDYRLLADRPDHLNCHISRIQATLELDLGEWTLRRGCTVRSQRGAIPVGLSETPFWLNDSIIPTSFIKMSFGSAVYIYRDESASCLLMLLDEEGLERLNQPETIEADQTQSYDLLDAIHEKFDELDRNVTARFMAVQASIESLYQSDRAQTRRLDTHSKTMTKYGGALVLLAVALFGGSQLLDPDQRKDVFLRAIDLLLFTGGGTGGLTLFQDAIDKRRIPK
jgi:hypothetical protein